MTPPVKLLLIFLSETDTWQNGPLYQAIVQRLRHLDVSGATVSTGIMGLGRHHRLHHKGLFGITDDRPITIAVVDEEQKLRAALGEVRAMAPDAVIVLVDVEMIP